MADLLFELAGKALAEHKPALAFKMIRQTVRENPDHDRPRHGLRYDKQPACWVAAYAARRLEKGDGLDERFGWLPSTDVARYEKVERKSQGKWLAAAADAKLHASSKTGWRIETEHYVVTTDHSLESGVQLG